MVVEFFLNEIKDNSKLYLETVEETESPFGTVEPCTIHQYVGDQYCKNAMSTVEGKLPGSKWIYVETVDQVNNKMFEVSINGRTYRISCMIETFEEGLANRMLVRIETSGDGAEESALAGYDQFLERLKFEIKATFRPDWETCVWLQDEQSEQLCSDLYPQIFRAENRLRAFANKVLIGKIGVHWIDSPGLEKYAESYQALAQDFRAKEASFSDVDDVFISTTLETMFRAMRDGMVYESPFQLSQTEFNKLMKIGGKSSNANIIDWIMKRRQVKLRLWEDVFEPYFSDTPNCKVLFIDFIKNRNHVAHNKPLSFGAYKVLEAGIIDFDGMIKAADQKFEDENPSKEFYLTMEIEAENAQAEAEREAYLRNYLRNRIADNTGETIRWRDEIVEMLSETMETFYMEVHDQYYLDNGYTVEPFSDLNDQEDEWQHLFSVTCNVCEDRRLEVQALLSVNDEMDGDSSLSLRCILYNLDEEEEVCSATIRYHNGSGRENDEEGTIELESTSNLDDAEKEPFFEGLKEAISKLNPYVPQIEVLEYEAVRHGGAYPVADFPCWECGKDCVSLLEEFYPFGHCCYCGSDNEVSICERCESPFNGDDGHDGICDACWERFEEE